MLLNEKQVRRIVRKNILKSMQTLNEVASIEMGGFTYTKGNEAEIQGEKGVKLVARDANNKVAPAETIFLPATFPKSGTPKKRESSDPGAAFVSITDEETIKTIKSMFEEVKEGDVTDFAADTKAMTPEVNNLLGMSAKDIFKLALRSSVKDGPESSIGKALSTMNNKFARLNKSLKDAGKLKNEVGIYINSPDAKNDNIIKVTGPSAGDFPGDLADYIRKLNQEGNASAMGIDVGSLGFSQIPKVLTEVIQDMIDKKFSILNFAEFSHQYSQLGEAKGVGNGSIIEGYLGSVHGAGATRAQSLDDFYEQLFGPEDQNTAAGERDASGSLKALANEGLISNTIPLFYLNIPGKNPVPVYTKGDKSYKNLVKNFVDGITKQTGGTTTQAQEADPGSGGGGGGTRSRDTASDTGDKVGGIRMTVQIDGQPDIKKLDDLGFKKGTDKALRQVLRKMVKNERKFKGTGNINLEVRYSGGGTKIKVKRKRGQRRSASRQIEGSLYARIEEYLTRAKYEPTRATDPNDPSDVTDFSDPTRQQWLASDGVKEKLSMRNRSRGRKEYFFNLTIKMF